MKKKKKNKKRKEPAWRDKNDNATTKKGQKNIHQL